MEFNAAAKAADLKIIMSGSYVLSLSEKQAELIHATKVAMT